MRQQILAIAWAQFRVSRNHLPRTGLGTLLGWLLALFWYGLYAALAVFLAFKIPEATTTQLQQWLPPGFLAVFLFWQAIPLFTLSSGWSLELNKLQIYPVNNNTLFGIETLLRLTSAPEMLMLLVGAAVGLGRRPDVPLGAPLVIFLFIPFNLFLQLGVRDLILHAFERNRFRELFAVIIISVAVLPQLLLRTSLGRTLTPYFFAAAKPRAAPWSEIVSLSLGHFQIVEMVLLLIWILLAFGFARWTFAKSLTADDSFQGPVSRLANRRATDRFRLSALPARFFGDPLAALIQKELQSLARMPRFRILFGMSCILGIIVFVPAALHGHDPTSRFMRNNLLPVVNVYGLLLLSDTLLLNAFGVDRGSAQVYFVTPVTLGTVLKAKNFAAIVFVVLQSAAIILAAAVARAPLTWKSVVSGLLASAVVTVFLLTTGNLTSIFMARPIDPKQTFKKQAGAKMQIWLLGCTLALFVLVGFAFLASYALQRDWVFLAVLGFEFLIGLLVYRFGLESAVERGMRDRETLVQMLSRSVSPMSVG
jgi:ABC-2 type transport system permease protein